MTTYTENCHLDSELTLRDRSHSPLSVHAVTLSLTKQDYTLIECRLTFQVSPELYQRIETEALFNLKAELRGSLSAGDFQPSGGDKRPKRQMPKEFYRFCRRAKYRA